MYKKKPESVHLIIQNNRMKTYVLMTCLLAFSYAIDPQTVEKVYKDYSSCFKELNVHHITPEVVKCYIDKNDLLDEQLRLKLKEDFVIWDNIISDENVLTQHIEAYKTMRKSL